MTATPIDDWKPDVGGFHADLDAKPAALEALAGSTAVRAAVAAVPLDRARVLFLGMGSSRYAAQVAAQRLRAAGIDAVAEYASARWLPPARPDTLVVAISASGTSKETVATAGRYAGRSTCVVLTEQPASPLAGLADVVIPMTAGHEAGGVACRTFQHTGLLLRLLEAHLTGQVLDFPGLCRRTAEATAELLEGRDDWLPRAGELLDSPAGVHVIGPAERWSSTAQSALVLREGPRRPATASETGDWNHVDVYLTKTTDYRALLLAGSPFDGDAMAWLRALRSTVVSVGAALDGADLAIGYAGAADEELAVHVETLVAELVAGRWWAAGEGA